jgi:hypothetical protein
MPRNDLLPPSVSTLDRIDNAEVASWADYFEALSAKASEASPKHQKIEGGLLISLPSWPGQVLNRFFGPIKSTSEGVGSIVSSLKSFRQTSGVHLSFQIRAADVQLGQMLVKHGLVASDHSWARFLRVPGALEQPETGLVVRPLHLWEATQFALAIERVFDLPPGIRSGSAEMLRRPGWKIFGAIDGDSVVATGAMFVHAGCGWLGFDTTMPDYRKQGLQQAIIAARVNSAVKSGIDLLTADTEFPRPGERDSSFDNYRRAEFGIAYERLNFSV